MVRFKNRYMTVQVDPVDKQVCALSLKSGSLYTSIINMVQQIHGDFGVGAVRSGLAAKYCNEHTRVAVIRARHGPHHLVASCLPLLTEVDRKKVRVRILYTGATLRQCYIFIKRYQMKELEKLWTTIKGDVNRTEMQRAFMDFGAVESLGTISSLE